MGRSIYCWLLPQLPQNFSISTKTSRTRSLQKGRCFTVSSFWENYDDLSQGHPKWWFSKEKPSISGKPGRWNILISASSEPGSPWTVDQRRWGRLDKEIVNVVFRHAVGGRNPANQLMGSLAHYIQGFIHPRWCRISSINSILENLKNNIFPCGVWMDLGRFLPDILLRFLQ